MTLCESKHCNGCTACANICPLGCITMQTDKEGFLQPVIDERRCVHCGKCEKVCPVLHTPQLEKSVLECYAAKNRNEVERANASSGGVFILVARWIIEQGGVVFGAAFDTDFSVEHRATRTMEEVTAFCGSKYVQSRIGDTYQQAKAYLKEGRWVLFSGTPCQIMGLKNYLGEEYSKLVTADIICHGVPSPAVWQHYLKYRARLDCQGGKLQHIQFRSKESGWSMYSVRFDYEKSEYKSPFYRDSYMRGFLKNIYLRQSCYACVAKGINRVSDLTLADFWGIQQVFPAMDDNKGVSLLLIHSDKGRSIWKMIEDQIVAEKVDAELALRDNPSAIMSSECHKHRARFFRMYKWHRDFSKYIWRLAPDETLPPLYRRVLSKIKRAVIGIFRK